MPRHRARATLPWCDAHGACGAAAADAARGQQRVDGRVGCGVRRVFRAAARVVSAQCLLQRHRRRGAAGRNEEQRREQQDEQERREARRAVGGGGEGEHDEQRRYAKPERQPPPQRHERRRKLVALRRVGERRRERAQRGGEEHGDQPGQREEVEEAEALGRSVRAGEQPDEHRRAHARCDALPRLGLRERGVDGADDQADAVVAQREQHEEDVGRLPPRNRDDPLRHCAKEAIRYGGNETAEEAAGGEAYLVDDQTAREGHDVAQARCEANGLLLGLCEVEGSLQCVGVRRVGVDEAGHERAGQGCHEDVPHREPSHCAWCHRRSRTTAADLGVGFGLFRACRTCLRSSVQASRVSTTSYAGNADRLAPLAIRVARPTRSRVESALTVRTYRPHLHVRTYRPDGVAELNRPSAATPIDERDGQCSVRARGTAPG
eukprot:scaffold129270_cov69-Phaeocystis_antarctica.AAC.1